MCSFVLCWRAGVVYIFNEVVVFFKQNTAYEMRISDWSSDVCASDLRVDQVLALAERLEGHLRSVGADQTSQLLCDSLGTPLRQLHVVGLGTRAVEIGRASCRESVCQYV